MSETTETPQPLTGETFRYRDTLTGQITEATDVAASVFPNRLVRVADDAKPYVPGMFKAGLVGEHDNPEPPTDEQLQAQAELDAVLEDSAPNSKAAREAKAAKETADAEAAAAAEAASASTKKTEGQ